jgi:predicted nucleotidyltransferase
MSADRVLGIAEARSTLPALIRTFSGNPDSKPVVIGSHRSPGAVLIPWERYGPPKPTLELLRQKASLIRTVARAHTLSTFSVIGSVARGESDEHSDVDLLCDTTESTSLYDITACERDLQQALGFPVTIIIRGSLTLPRDAEFLEGAVSVC